MSKVAALHECLEKRELFHKLSHLITHKTMLLREHAATQGACTRRDSTIVQGAKA